MKLLNLTLDHFKRVSHFDFIPDGKNAVILGDNATGKTTIADGYFWLLFGKDSSGKSDFDILPMDKNGNILEGLEAYGDDSQIVLGQVAKEYSDDPRTDVRMWEI